METSFNSRKAALYSLILSLAVTGLLGIAALIIGTFGALQVKVLFTSLTVSAGSILALACGAAIEKDLDTAAARLGFGVAVAGTAMVLVGIWADFSEDIYWKTTGSFVVIATGIALHSLLSFANLAERFRWVRWANIASIASLCVLIMVAMWVEPAGDLIARLIGIASILVAVFAITTPVLHFVSRIDDSASAARVGTIQTTTSVLPGVINLAEKVRSIGDYWQPHIVAELNGQAVKVARILGEFDFHHHADEDELFLVLKGEMRLEFLNGSINLRQGDAAVVPRGVEHRPVATEEAHILLFEPVETLNTGNLSNERTVAHPPRI